jgi:hypothetical protein
MIATIGFPSTYPIVLPLASDILRLYSDLFAILEKQKTTQPTHQTQNTEKKQNTKKTQKKPTSSSSSSRSVTKSSSVSHWNYQDLSSLCLPDCVCFNPFVRNRMGNTALHRAIAHKRYSAAHLLLAVGACPFITNNQGQDCVDVFRSQLAPPAKSSSSSSSATSSSPTTPYDKEMLTSLSYYSHTMELQGLLNPASSFYLIPDVMKIVIAYAQPTNEPRTSTC